MIAADPPEPDYPDSWYAASQPGARAWPALRGRHQVETAVIGAGLAGLSTALRLAEAGRSVAVIEARRIGWGASGRNGGFVSAGGFSVGLAELVARHGIEQARAWHDLSREGWRQIKDWIAAYDIACGPHIDGHLRPSCFNDIDALRSNRDAVNQIFGRRLRLVEPDELATMVSSPRYRAALFDPEGLQIHPLNYCHGLAAAAADRGALLFEASPVRAVDTGVAENSVTCDDGAIAARHLVFAMGGYQGRLLRPLARAVLPIATYVMATEPIAPELLETAIRVPYAIADDRFATDYYRLVPGPRLLWGGRVSVRQSEPPALDAKMHGDMARIYPQLASVRPDRAWMGTMSYARHRMPQIGALGAPGDGIWYAQGFGGLGLNTTAMAGRLLAEAIAGESDRYRLFARFGLDWSGGPFGLAAAQATYWSRRLRDRLRGAPL